MYKYLISTNVDGHLYSNYSTERLMDLNEAKEKLAYVREVDPNAKLVEVVENDERRNNLATAKTVSETPATEIHGLAVMKKILALREKVKEVESSKMDSNGIKYNYLSENKLTTTIRPVMQELGLVAVPVESVSKTSSYMAGYDKDGRDRYVLLTENHSAFLVMDTDSGDSVVITVEGSGADSMDKGTNKASTCAVKNFYKALLNLPSPERDDPDNTPSNGGFNRASSSYNDPGSIQLKYGPHTGKTLRQLFDENPEEVEKLANGTSKWIAEKAQAFLNSLAA